MTTPQSSNKFIPKQALTPSPQLYDELVGDCMEKLASATLPSLPNHSVIHDNGCGTGASTAAIASATSASHVQVSIKGTDINEQALEIYRKAAGEKRWPTEAAVMDSNALSFPDETFTHSLGSAFLFMLPDDGVGAMKEAFRTLKPGGIAAVNSFAYVPNVVPIVAAAQATRPAGTPVLGQGLEKWEDAEFLRSVVVQGGFEKEKVEVKRAEVRVTTSTDMLRYATLLWSFLGGLGGWLESDEGNWDRAVGVVMEELEKTEGFGINEDGTLRLRFVANIAVATK